MPKGYHKDGTPLGYWNKGKTSKRRNGKYVQCPQCGKTRYYPKCRIKKQNFCSKKCAYKFKTGKPINVGENNPNWKGGKIVNYHKYNLVLQKNHPRCDHYGYVKQSTLVMENKIGRFLEPQEVVHHINRITTDDKPENLMLFPNNSEHIRHHRLNY